MLFEVNRPTIAMTSAAAPATLQSAIRTNVEELAKRTKCV
jgi:hypothetical protein